MKPSGRGTAIGYLAAAMASLLLAAAAGARLPALGLLAIGSCLVFAVLGLLALRQRRDPYDLQLLREIHEREEMLKARVPDPHGDLVYCPYCSDVYSSEYPMCPKCGRSAN